MKKAATMAFQAGIEKFARQLPPVDWFKAGWPTRRTSGPAISAPPPR